MTFWKKFLIHFAMILILAFTLIPILVMFNISLKPGAEILAKPTKWLFTPTFENYREVFLLGPYSSYLWNSVIIGVVSTALSICLGTMAAYAVARYQLAGNITALSVFIIRMIPPIAVMTPLFLFIRQVGAGDTYWGLIFLHTAFNLPFVLWLMLGFFRELPLEIEEAARIDGCTQWQVFYKVALPLVKGGMVAAGIFCLLSSWNEFPFAFISTGSKTRTLTVAALNFKSDEGIHYGNVMAFGSVALLPVMIASLLFQRRLVNALTGAVKG
jgi:multiple sugar transport system permease protein